MMSNYLFIIKTKTFNKSIDSVNKNVYTIDVERNHDTEGRKMKEMLIGGAPAKVNKALAAVLVARAKYQAADETDRETKKEILAANDFREEESGKRITEYKTDFLMSEADFQRYCELVYRRNLQKGLDSGGAGLTFWPLQQAVYAAEDAYIDTVISDLPQYTPKMISSVKKDLKLRAKFLQISGL